jgi:hypothetical protein
MLPLIELWREAARSRDMLCRRIDKIVRQTGVRIGRWVAIEAGPPRIMVQDNMIHWLGWRQRFEPFVAEGTSKLMRERRMLIHHNR